MLVLDPCSLYFLFLMQLPMIHTLLHVLQLALCVLYVYLIRGYSLGPLSLDRETKYVSQLITMILIIRSVIIFVLLSYQWFLFSLS